MTALDRRPARHSSWIAVGASGLAVLLFGVLSAVAAFLGLLSLLFVGVGLYRSSHAWLSGGALWFGLAVVAVAQSSGSVVGTGAVVILGVVAWDAATRAVQVGHQLTRAAETHRMELLHSATTAAVGIASLSVGYGASLVVNTPNSVPVVAALALGVLACLVVLLRS